MEPSTKPVQKSYRKGSSLYFSAGLVLSMVLVVTAFEWKTVHSLLDEPISSIIEKRAEDPIFKPVVMPAPPKPKITSPNIVTTKDPIVTEPKEIDPPVDLGITPPTDFNPLDVPAAFGPPVDVKPSEADMVSKLAVPANGYTAFHQYIYDGIRVPQHIIDRNKDGRVVVTFVVETDGKLSNIQIVEGFDPQLEKQIIKLIQDAPAWEPAVKNGRKVSTQMKLPITITIAH